MQQGRANRPLSDVTVIDFGQIFQGPYASLLLAKAGAFVIKIEPLHGEPGRRRAEPGKSATLPFAMLNQNKHAVTLNLKHERGRELLFRMAERADVLLENFSPGTMDDLGVGWARLRETNPRLIYAPGTGFAISGPDRHTPAMDMTIQAARVAHMEETDALVAEWTRTLGTMEVFARAKAYRIPCAPVRSAPEVMNDPHMHERGMLERIDHPELGEVVVRTTPLRLHGTDKVAAGPSPTIGQHNAEIYGGWLGLSAAEIAELEENGVV